MHRRVHGEIGVGNDFEACERVALPLLRAADDQPAAFICGSPQIFERPLGVNVGAPRFAAKLAGRFSSTAKSRNTSSAMIAIPCRSSRSLALKAALLTKRLCLDLRNKKDVSIDRHAPFLNHQLIRGQNINFAPNGGGRELPRMAVPRPKFPLATSPTGLPKLTCLDRERAARPPAD